MVESQIGGDEAGAALTRLDRSQEACTPTGNAPFNGLRGSSMMRFTKTINGYNDPRVMMAHLYSPFPSGTLSP